MLDVEVKVETYINECFVGIIGYWNNDASDCDWMRYSPSLPVWSHSLMDNWDLTSEFMEWKCNYNQDAFSSEPDNTNNEGDTIFEPSNVDEYGEDYGVEDDPNNVNNDVNL